MTTQHTPGPWVINRGDYSDTASIGSSDWWGLAEVFIRLEGDTKDHPAGLANARLIAAAPDLLEALERVLRVSDRATADYYFAKAAIKKAKGE